MRVRSILTAMVILLLIAATCATAQNGTVHKYDSYGVSVTLPGTCERMSLQVPAISGLIEAYKGNNLVYVVVITDDVQPKTMTARAALNTMVGMMNQIASKVPELGLHTISGSSAQGVSATGFAARVSESQIKAMGKNPMNYVAQMPPEIRQMFGSDVYQAVLLAPLTEKGRTVAGIAVIGAGSRSMDIDAEAMRVMGALSIGEKVAAAKPSGAKSGEASGTPAPAAAPLNTLKKGQIELVGTVSFVDKPGKSLNMMVSQVTSFGQPGVVLDPARLKKVFAKSIAAAVKEGVKIAVVAADSGVGKPVTAQILKVIEAAK